MLERVFFDFNDDFYFKDFEVCVFFLEDCNYYVMENVLWVFECVCWLFIQGNVKQFNIVVLLDEVMGLIEVDNFKLDGLLLKVYVCIVFEQNILGLLIDLVVFINFDVKDGGDVLGDVYEYFLGNFVGVEGKNVGEFFIIKFIVSVIVEVLVL